VEPGRNIKNLFVQGFGGCGAGCVSGSVCSAHAEPLSPQPSTSGLCCRPQPSTGGLCFRPQPSAGGLCCRPQPSAGGLCCRPQPSAGGLCCRPQHATASRCSEISSSIEFRPLEYAHLHQLITHIKKVTRSTETFTSLKARLGLLRWETHCPFLALRLG